jgi:hypothetical protein
VIIPASVETLGRDCFSTCTALKSVHFGRNRRIRLRLELVVASHDPCLRCNSPPLVLWLMQFINGCFFRERLSTAPN